MRALLIILGILLFIGGCIGTIVLPVLGLINGISEMVGEEGEQPSEWAQAVCDAGETGVQDAVRERIAGGGTETTLRFYCVDDGEQRDVTDDVANYLFSNPQELLSFLNVSPVMPAIALGGVLFFIFGLFYRPRQEQPAVGMPIQMESSAMSQSRRRAAQSSTPTVVVKTKTFDASGGSSSFADLMKEVKSKAPTTDDETLVVKLQQLDDAKAKNLITPAEYDQMRKQILDSMK